MSDAVLISLIVAGSAIITSSIGVIGIRAANRTHDLINSRMTELLDLTRAQARAEGYGAGEQAQRDRAADPQK